MPSLLAKEGPLAGQRLHVVSELVFGRGEADVVVEDLEISRRHALVRAGEDFLEVEDLGSLNGTWVNGRRIGESTRVSPGDSIRLGQTVLEVEDDPAQRDESARSRAAAQSVRVGLASSWSVSPVDFTPLGGSRCPECKTVNSRDARFCSHCGTTLRAEQDPPLAPAAAPAPAQASSEEADSDEGSAGAQSDELRTVTALFADVVGSTALGERLAPDEVKALIGECVNRMARVAEQFGGTVGAYMGDGIAAFFGMPTAHEDDPERAAQAALSIVEVVAEYALNIETAWGVTDFHVRVGVNTGQTAVGVVGAADLQQVALGDTVNVAARLQAGAAPGSVVIGGSTARLLAHRFILESLGELDVKGRVQRVTAWRLVRSQVHARAPAPTPLVGRKSEVSRLRAILDELKDGRGRVLLLVGDAGVGKSRILDELETVVAGNRLIWLEGQCRSYGGELVYWPFAEVLRRWLGVEAGEVEVSVRTKLRARLASLSALEPEDVVRGLGRLLSLRVGAMSEGVEPSAEENAEEIRRAFCTWVEALTADEPVVLAIDDFQWADLATRELAEALLEVTDRAPLLLAMALRADSASEGFRFRLNTLEHYAHRVVDLTIEPLSDTACGELLGMLVPEAFEQDARKELIARAEGNPLYLEELFRSLIEGGGLERRQRTWALTSASATIVPPALEGLLMARIDRLSDEGRHLLQIAAAIGRTFPAKALERAASLDDFERPLAMLVRGQFIRELTRYPELVYSFKHGLLHDAALSTLTPSRRRELYGRVAAAFEELYPARDDHLEILAYYYARSQNLPKAREYLELAAARAVSLNANAQAAELWNRARKIAAQLNDVPAERRIAEQLGRLA